MDAQELRNLQEAYMEVVMNEGEKPFPFKRVSDRLKKKNYTYQQGFNMRSTIAKELKKAQEREARERHEKRSPLFYNKKKVGKMNKSSTKGEYQREQTDLYDIILSHLLDEGYAETPEAAEAIMVNMSEEWRDNIIG